MTGGFRWSCAASLRARFGGSGPLPCGRGSVGGPVPLPYGRGSVLSLRARFGRWSWAASLRARFGILCQSLSANGFQRRVDRAKRDLRAHFASPFVGFASLDPPLRLVLVGLETGGGLGGGVLDGGGGFA